jgi:hypothetical protein
VEKFEPKKNDVTREWGKLHNEELIHLYSSPNIVRVIRSRRMGWTGRIAHMGGEDMSIQGFGGET